MIHLGENEKELVIIRKHWFVYLAEGIAIGILVFLPWVFSKLVSISDFIQISGSSYLLFIFLSTIWLLFCWNLFFVIWTNNFLDMLIITDKRVIDIEQIGLFHRDTSSFYLDRIEDITVEKRGIIASVFDFGNIHIQTAGEDRELRLNHIENPEKIRKLISEAQRKHEQK